MDFRVGESVEVTTTVTSQANQSGIVPDQVRRGIIHEQEVIPGCAAREATGGVDQEPPSLAALSTVTFSRLNPVPKNGNSYEDALISFICVDVADGLPLAAQTIEHLCMQLSIGST